MASAFLLTSLKVFLHILLEGSHLWYIELLHSEDVYLTKDVYPTLI